MRQLNLTDYSMRLRDAVSGEYKDVPYEVKDALVEILLARTLGLSGVELLQRDDLAHKIMDCIDGEVLLEEEEWGKLVSSVNTIKGLGRQDVELVRRVIEAPKIEVEEKKK